MVGMSSSDVFLDSVYPRGEGHLISELLNTHFGLLYQCFIHHYVALLMKN